jgi:hypothetical protein
MAIQKEPGQKGVNWSNIAVGERVLCSTSKTPCLLGFHGRWDHEHGTYLLFMAIENVRPLYTY